MLRPSQYNSCSAILSLLTASNTMNLVLDEEVNQRHQSSEKQPSQNLPVLDGTLILRAESKAPNGPREREDQVRNHENVVPVVVVGAGDVDPATTQDRPEEAHERDELGSECAGPSSQDIPQEYEHEPWPGCDSDEELEDGPLGVAVTDGGRDGGKPFVRIALKREISGVE